MLLAHSSCSLSFCLRFPLERLLQVSTVRLRSRRELVSDHFLLFDSVECQTPAWKAGHKESCGKPAPAIEEEEKDDIEIQELTSTQASV